MNRAIESRKKETFNKRELAEMAAASVSHGMDSYSEYSVGVAVCVELRDIDTDYQSAPEKMYESDLMASHVYCGSNINLSGMEVKIHAEQLAVFQAILDIVETGMTEYSKLTDVMVITSEDDLALKCGHCLQTIAGICDEFNWDKGQVSYTAAKGNVMEDDKGNPEGVHYTYDEYTLQELMPESYVDKN